MSYRHEEKIPLTPAEAVELETRLTARGMVRLFPERLIHSVYFETPDFRMLNDGEEGVLPRRKVRIRHYPEAQTDQGQTYQGQSDQGGIAHTMETKISAVEGRFKLARRLPLTEARMLMRNGIFDNDYGVIQPTLIVTYKRRYFQMEGVRITFDRQIRYARATPQSLGKAGGAAAPRRHSWDGIDEPWQVCELKAPIHASTDHLMRVLDIPRRRFSKFANGMLAICQGRPTADASMVLMAGRE